MKLKSAVFLAVVTLCFAFLPNAAAASEYDCGTYSAGCYNSECLDESVEAPVVTPLPASVTSQASKSNVTVNDAGIITAAALHIGSSSLAPIVTLDVTAQWATADSANSITCRSVILESLN